jgi:hypothetical protein
MQDIELARVSQALFGKGDSRLAAGHSDNENRARGSAIIAISPWPNPPPLRV